MSCEFKNYLQRTMEQRRLASGPDTSGVRSKKMNLSPRGRPSGEMEAEQGPTARMAGPTERKFSLEHTVVGFLFRNLANNRDGVVHPNPTSSGVDGVLT